MRTLETGKLPILAERYVDRCRGNLSDEGDAVEIRFPNLAGFARSLGVGTVVLCEMAAEYPDQYDAMLAIFEDEALNAAKNATAINTYIRERLAIGERCKGDAATGESIVEHIINLKTQMMKVNVTNPDDIVLEISPDIAAILLKAKIDLGTDNTEAFENGLLGKIAGCKIYVSNNIMLEDGYYKCFFRTKRAVAFAEQISEVEAYRPEKRFADAVKGLHLYGAKIVYPDEFMVLSLKPAE